MNKSMFMLFLYAVFHASFLLCSDVIDSKDYCDPFESFLTKDEQKYMDFVCSFDEEKCDDIEFVIAFEALKFIAKNKGISIPFSTNYIKYIFSDSFKNKLVKRLAN